MSKVNERKIAQQFASLLESREASRKAHTPFSNDFVKHLDIKKDAISPSPAEKTKQTAPEAPKQRTVKVSNRTIKISGLQAKRLAKYSKHIENSAKKNSVPIELICGVILQESGGKSKAVSHCGAKGLMQLMPGTAKRFGVQNSFDPEQNIEGGTRYLKWLMKRFDGDLELVLAAYNAGEGNVEKYGNKIPPFRETQKYVPNVLAYTQSMINIFVSRNAAPEFARRV